MLVLAVAAIVVGRWCYRSQQQQLAVRAIADAGGTVTYQWELDDRGKRIRGASPGYPRWLIGSLGMDYFCRVHRVALYPTRDCPADEQLEFLDGLRHVETLAILPGHERGTGPMTSWHKPGGVTDGGVDYLLNRHRAIHSLCIWSAQISDSKVKELANMSQIEFLSICRHADFGGDCPVFTRYDRDNNRVKVVRLIDSKSRMPHNQSMQRVGDSK